MRSFFFALVLAMGPTAILADGGAATTSSGLPDGAAAGSLTEALSGSTLGMMTVSEPLIASGGVMALPAPSQDDGMPDLAVQDLCAAQAETQVNVALAYEGCMTVETAAYDLLEAGMTRYDPDLFNVCTIAARMRGGSYVAMLDCIGP